MTYQTLVTTDWLCDHLYDPNVRIVDIRGHVVPASEPLPHYFNHREDYQKSHIPGAVFIDWVNEITDPADPRHAKIAPPQRFAEVMNRYGIGPDTFVIVYDDAGSMFAARLYWALNYNGHENVAVLDGGWQKWTAENRPTTAEVPTYPPANFVATPNPALIRTLDQVQAAMHDPTAVLMDVRTPEEFAGQFARAPRKGHIPGAVNVPKANFNAADGTIRPAPVLQNLIQLEADQSPIFYCNGGVSASLGFLVARIAGVENAAVYDGSWKEWGNQADTPIE